MQFNVLVFSFNKRNLTSWNKRIGFKSNNKLPVNVLPSFTTCTCNALQFGVHTCTCTRIYYMYRMSKLNASDIFPTGYTGVGCRDIIQKVKMHSCRTRMLLFIHSLWLQIPHMYTYSISYSNIRTVMYSYWYFRDALTQ